MNKLFDNEGPVMSFLSKMADLLWLNILTIVFCIPIITAGASITALYAVTVKLVNKEEGYITKDFMKAFKTNFKQGTLLWLIILVVIALFYADYRILMYSAISFPKIFLVLLAGLLLLCGCTCIYLFPLLSRYDNTLKNIIKNSFLLSISSLPKTILIIVIHILPFVALYFFQMAFPLVLMFGPSLTAYVSSYIFVSIFKKLEGSMLKVEDDEGIMEEIEESTENNSGIK